MAAPAILQVSRDRAQSLRSALARLRAEQRNGLVQRDAEAIVAEVLTIPESLRRTWDVYFDFLCVGPIAEFDHRGKELLDLIDAGVETVRETISFAEVSASTGAPLAGAERLAGAIESLLAFRQYMVAHWPRFPSPEQWERWTEEAKQAPSVDLDEAFAEAAGVPVEEWRQRVAEHKRRHGPAET